MKRRKTTRIWQTKEWRINADKVRGDHCKICGKTEEENGRKLTVQHLQRAKTKEEYISMVNTATFCRGCAYRWDILDKRPCKNYSTCDGWCRSQYLQCYNCNIGEEGLECHRCKKLFLPSEHGDNLLCYGCDQWAMKTKSFNEYIDYLDDFE